MLSTLGALEAGVTSRAPSRSSRSASRRAFATVRAAATELEQLATMSKLVVDSGDLSVLRKGCTLWKPTDATTNPRRVTGTWQSVR